MANLEELKLEPSLVLREIDGYVRQMDSEISKIIPPAINQIIQTFYDPVCSIYHCQ